MINKLRQENEPLPTATTSKLDWTIVNDILKISDLSLSESNFLILPHLPLHGWHENFARCQNSNKSFLWKKTSEATLFLVIIWQKNIGP